MNFPRWIYSKDGNSVTGTIVYNESDYDAVKSVFNLDSHGGNKPIFININALKSKIQEAPNAVQREEEGRKEEVILSQEEAEKWIDNEEDKDKIESYIKKFYSVDLDKRKSIANFRKAAKAVINGNG